MPEETPHGRSLQPRMGAHCLETMRDSLCLITSAYWELETGREWVEWGLKAVTEQSGPGADRPFYAHERISLCGFLDTRPGGVVLPRFVPGLPAT